MNAKTPPAPTNAVKPAKSSLQVDASATGEPLRKCVELAMQQYFKALDGHECCELYDFVIGEVEVPLLQAVLQYTAGNQTKASQMLGVNRGTLRKKLRHYGLD